MFSPALHALMSEAQVADTTRFRHPITPAGAVDHDLAGAAHRAGDEDRRNRRLVRHYIEMVVVMFLGMFVLMTPTGWLLGVAGTSWSRLSPAMNMFTMALTMTIPMVGWMRYRGHAWRPNIEMAASMLIPTFAVMAVLWAGVAKSGTLVVPEHAGMLACMLAAMLLRRDEYSCARHPGGQIHSTVA